MSPRRASGPQGDAQSLRGCSHCSHNNSSQKTPKGSNSFLNPPFGSALNLVCIFCVAFFSVIISDRGTVCVGRDFKSSSYSNPFPLPKCNRSTNGSPSLFRNIFRKSLPGFSQYPNSWELKIPSAPSLSSAGEQQQKLLGKPSSNNPWKRQELVNCWILLGKLLPYAGDRDIGAWREQWSLEIRAFLGR